MAVNRTVLPRKGLIQPQNNASWNVDGDANWALLDANYQDATDVTNAINAQGISKQLVTDLGINGVYSGFTLGVGSGLVPAITSSPVGVLYAQGTRVAPGIAPTLPTMPVSSTRYLYYNSSTGFYYTITIGATSVGDAFIGTVVSGVATISSVTSAAKEGGLISVAPTAAGNFSVAHNLGKAPTRYYIRMTSLAIIAEQATADNTNLYLQASEANVTAKIEVW